MDDLVSLAIVEGAVVLYSEVGKIILDWLQASDPRLVLDGIKDLVDGESQRSEILFRPKGLEWAWREDRESLSLEGILPLVLILDMGGGLVQRL